MRYGVVGNVSSLIMNVPGGATTELNVFGLNPASNYSIQVAAVNIAGTGMYSTPLFVLTEGTYSIVFRSQILS